MSMLPCSIRNRALLSFVSVSDLQVIIDLCRSLHFPLVTPFLSGQFAIAYIGNEAPNKIKHYLVQPNEYVSIDPRIDISIETSSWSC